MRLPHMTTRQLIVAVVVIAVWFAFVSRARRLRGIGNEHMRQYVSQCRVAVSLREHGNAVDADAASASAVRFLRSAEQHNVEADFVESFTLTLLLAAVFFGAIVLVRHNRRPSQRPPAAQLTVEDGGPPGGA